MTPAVSGLGRRVVAAEKMRGAVVLATCNRVEVYVDAEAPGSFVAGQVRRAILGGLAAPIRVRMSTASDADALQHLFDVGAGLDSMVVGEREIAGQLRRALRAARADGTASGLLTETIEQALRTSRRVSHLTQLATTGRSIVAVGLDLLRRDWTATSVLLLGTGAYAGAVSQPSRAGSATLPSIRPPGARCPSSPGTPVPARRSATWRTRWRPPTWW